jgi:hypothetical protein
MWSKLGVIDGEQAIASPHCPKTRSPSVALVSKMHQLRDFIPDSSIMERREVFALFSAFCNDGEATEASLISNRIQQLQQQIEA